MRLNALEEPLDRVCGEGPISTDVEGGRRRAVLADTGAGPEIRGETGSPRTGSTLAELSSQSNGRVITEAAVLQTEDLFLGALGLVRGGELRDIEVRGVNGKPLAVFRIEGPGMDDVEREYHRGPSVVDLRLLKSEVARLKNLAFQALRQEEMRDASHQGRDRAYPGRERPGRAAR